MANKTEVDFAKRFLLAFIILSLFAISIVHAAPPVTFISSSSDMQIESPKYDSIRLGDGHIFHAHVINATAAKTNTTTSCILHLYNQTGSDISLVSQMNFENNGIDFTTTINGNNFSSVGTYAYVVQCNSTNEVAFYSAQIDVTQNGSLSTVESILYGPYLLLIIAIMFLVTAITFTNERWLVKSALFIISLLFIILAINASMGYAMNQKNIILLSSGFIIAVSSVSLLFIVMLIYYLISLARAIKDSKREKQESLL